MRSSALPGTASGGAAPTSGIGCPTTADAVPTAASTTPSRSVTTSWPAAGKGTSVIILENSPTSMLANTTAASSPPGLTTGSAKVSLGFPVARPTL